MVYSPSVEWTGRTEKAILDHRVTSSKCYSKIKWIGASDTPRAPASPGGRTWGFCLRENKHLYCLRSFYFGFQALATEPIQLSKLFWQLDLILAWILSSCSAGISFLRRQMQICLIWVVKAPQQTIWISHLHCIRACVLYKRNKSKWKYIESTKNLNSKREVMLNKEFIRKIYLL